MLNTQVLQEIQKSWKKILIVTKYWDTIQTATILQEIKQNNTNTIIGIGENRIESIIQKKLPREDVHFIGNIQSKKIPEIVKHCSVIHSLDSLKHAHIIEKQRQPTGVFIQIQLDAEKSIWVTPHQLWWFVEACNKLHFVQIIGISGMGRWEFNEQQKRSEFQLLTSLRDSHLPDWHISAWTSRDYMLALEEWIDIVRVGQKAITKPL